MAQKFRSRPVEIEAVRLSWATWSEVCAFCTNPGFKGTYLRDGVPTEEHTEQMGAFIPTLEGVMLAQQGDWIIKGLLGEFYPCKDEVFQLKYEALDGK